MNKKIKKNKLKETSEESKVSEGPYDVLCRYKCNAMKERLEVPGDEITDFAQSIVNIFRLNALKLGVGNKNIKKIKTATPKNLNSKKSIKTKERVRLIKKKKNDAKKEREEKRKKREWLYALAKGNKTK